MNPIDLTAAERFMNRARVTAQSRSKEMRMPVEEVLELSVCLGQVLARLHALTPSSAPVASPQPSLDPSPTALDGGTFS